MDATAASPELLAARALVQQQRMDDAERAFAKLADGPAPPLEAFSFLAMSAFRRRDVGKAISHLEHALRVEPNEPRFLTDLGVAYRSQNELEKAADAFRRALKAAPGNFVARLHLGTVSERLGKPREALLYYFGAITAAQMQGQWVSRETVKPSLAAEVSHAMAFSRQSRRQLYAEAIAPIRARYGADEMKRVEHCLAIHLGEKPRPQPDARQRPLMMYFPDIPSQTYFTRDQIPWARALEEAAEVIREEASSVVSAGGLPSFLKSDDKATVDASIKSADTQAPPVWDAFFFYRDGQPLPDSHSCAPRTATVLESLPLIRIPNYAPEICFSVLTPGTEILPHCGVTNTRIVVHLPLLVPQNCALMVGGETHVWQEGQVIAFDDTFEHSAWNRSDGHIRVVMLMDAWNPYLTEAERAALTDLVMAIGDLTRDSMAA